MKTIRLSYLPLAILGIAFFMNSCSSSQQFAGYYPENRITGKGIGQAVTQQKPEAPTALVATTEQKVVAADVAPAVEPTAEPVKKQKGDRILKWATKVSEKKMAQMAAYNNGGSKSLFGLREKFTKKIVAKMMAKYGMNSMNASSSAAGIERVSRPMAITSFAVGLAALLPFVGWFFGPAAIATGVIALIGINRGGDGKKWMAICGIAFGAAAFVLAFVWAFAVFAFI